jgi:hypothetical protein
MLKRKSRVSSAVFSAAIIFSALAVSAAGSGGVAEAASYDKFGVQKLYPTKDSREWYVNMNDPKSDSMFRNWKNVAFTKKSDGSWQVSADQIRLEAWSPSYKKWLNVEITAYVKITSSSNPLIQLYSRGGHHTSSNECLGSAYKARLYGDGRATWVKELTHPAYTGNRGSIDVASNIEDRWVGFKAVIYNYQSSGKTYVMMKSYIDDSVTDSRGNLVVKNNWKLASTVRDTGDWKTSDSDFNSSCGKTRSSILTGPGGTSTQNIAGFRTDDSTWQFKYLSVREIVPP